MKQYKTGLSGEEIAEGHLCQNGMTLLARRYRAGDGEIDLILLDDDCVVFAEVKFRPQGKAGSGLIAVTPLKQRRMTNAAQHFLFENNWLDRNARFDVVEITSDGVLHIPNAFMPTE